MLALLTLAALLLRLPGYLVWWFNPDEAIYWQVSTFDAERAWALVASNAHPPLYYALLRGLARVDDSALWLRLPSLIAGVALVPLMLALTRRCFGVTSGLIAAGLVCVAPTAIAQSQVMRPYALQLAALALALLGLASFLRGGAWRGLLLYSLAMAVALGLHYSGFIALAGVGLALGALTLARRFAARQVFALAAAHVLPFALMAWLYFGHVAPRLQGSGLQSEARDGWLQGHFIQNPLHALKQLSDLYFASFGIGSVAVLVCVAAWVHWRGRPSRAALGSFLARHAQHPQDWILPLAVLATALVLSSLGLYPLGRSRHSAYLLPFLLPPVAAGAAALLASAPVTSLLESSRRMLVIGLLLLAAGVQGLAASLGEGLVRRGEAAAVELSLRVDVPAQALVLTDHQTLQFLIVLLGAEPSGFRLRGDSGLSQCKVGSRTFLLMPEPTSPFPIWGLPWMRGQAASGASLERAIELIEAQPALARRIQQHGPWVVLGGGGRSLIAGDRARSSSAPALFDRSAGGASLALCRLDLAAYRAYLGGE